MNVKNMNRGLSLLAVILSVFMLLTLSVVPAFAEDSASTESATDAATEVATEAATTEGTEATTEAATTADTEASTQASTTTSEKDNTTSIINLIVGGVILVVVVVLAIVFRKKIPGWFKALKSECGKISWCPKDKLKKNTFVVVVTIVAITAVIFALDWAFSTGIVLLGKLFH